MRQAEYIATRTGAADEELVEVLTAISVVSMRLAKSWSRPSQKSSNVTQNTSAFRPAPTRSTTSRSIRTAA